MINDTISERIIYNYIDHVYIYYHLSCDERQYVKKILTNYL